MSVTTSPSQKGAGTIDGETWSQLSHRLRAEWAYWADRKAWADALMITLPLLVGTLLIVAVASLGGAFR